MRRARRASASGAAGDPSAPVGSAAAFGEEPAPGHDAPSADAPFDAPSASVSSSSGAAPMAAPAPPAPAPAVAGDPWVLLLQMLGARRAALGATLSGSAVLGEEERILKVAVPRYGAFQKGQLEKTANRQLIMELIRETFGRPLGVKFEPAPPGAGPESGAPGGAAADPDRATGVAGPGSASAPNGAATAGADQGGNASGAKRPRGKSIAEAPTASPEGIRRIVDLFGGDVIGPA